VSGSDEEKYFLDCADRFHQALESSVKISERAIGISHTGRQNRALFVYTKLILHCMAIAALLEKYSDSPDGEGLLDHCSIAALGRTVIDAALMAMYISDPKFSRDEWDVRRQILFLHDLSNRKRFLTSMEKAGGLLEENYHQNHDEVKKGLLDKILRLGTKLGFPDDKIDEFSKGQTVYINGIRGAVREAGWDVNEFDFQQSYLSNWVHSHPVSFIRAHDQAISLVGPAAYQFYVVGLVLDICQNYINDTTTRMAAFTGSESKDHLGHVE
jgi:hypothetical protein